MDELCCDGLKCNTLSLAIFGDFSLLYFMSFYFWLLQDHI